MFRLLITYSNSFTGGGAVCTTILVPYETKEQADAVCEQIQHKPNYSILKLYAVEEE